MVKLAAVLLLMASGKTQIGKIAITIRPPAKSITIIDETRGIQITLPLLKKREVKKADEEMAIVLNNIATGKYRVKLNPAPSKEQNPWWQYKGIEQEFEVKPNEKIILNKSFPTTFSGITFEILGGINTSLPVIKTNYSAMAGAFFLLSTPFKDTIGITGGYFEWKPEIGLGLRRFAWIKYPLWLQYVADISYRFNSKVITSIGINIGISFFIIRASLRNIWNAKSKSVEGIEYNLMTGVMIW